MSILSQTATAIETVAGVATTANPTEAGYWERIAIAAEALAGASSAANNNVAGYMKRTAIALNSYNGFSGGAPYNLTEAGYIAWQVAGLEFKQSTTTLGSLESRLLQLISLIVPGVSLATPTLAISSTLGAAPLVLSASDTDVTMGLFGQLQIDQTSNAFSNITQDILFFIDASNIANLDEAIGLATPPGLYFARFRVVRDNDSGATTVTSNEWNGQAFNAVTLAADVSLWSNIKTDTIISSVAVFAHSVSTDFKSGLAFSNTDHTMLGQAFGAFQGSRANLAGASKAQFEIHLDILQTGSAVYFGIENGSTDFSAFNALPGYSNANGVTIALVQGNTTISVFRNSAGTQTDFTAAAAPATGATFTCEYDRTLAGGSQILSVYRNGTLIGTVSGLTITTFTKFWVGVRNDDQVTINPGNAAFVHALNTGYVMYG